MNMSTKKSMKSISLNKFLSYFTDEEEIKIVAFFQAALKEENKKHPDRKNRDSISLRILPYEKAKHYLNRHLAHSNEETPYKFITKEKFHVSTLKEPAPINAQFHLKLFDVIGDDRMKVLTQDLGNSRLYFTINAWLKTKRNEAIIADLQDETPDYKIERRYGITADYLRQIRHRAKQAGKL